MQQGRSGLRGDSLSACGMQKIRQFQNKSIHTEILCTNPITIPFPVKIRVQGFSLTRQIKSEILRSLTPKALKTGVCDLSMV